MPSWLQVSTAIERALVEKLYPPLANLQRTFSPSRVLRSIRLAEFPSREPNLFKELTLTPRSIRRAAERKAAKLARKAAFRSQSSERPELSDLPISFETLQISERPIQSPEHSDGCSSLD